jgi:hypothetical protein
VVSTWFPPGFSATENLRIHSDNFIAQMPALGRVRGRLGWASDNVMLYGASGIAVVDGKITGSALGLMASTENSNIGWTAGGGGGFHFDGHVKDNIVRGRINYYIFN